MSNICTIYVGHQFTRSYEMSMYYSRLLIMNNMDHIRPRERGTWSFEQILCTLRVFQKIQGVSHQVDVALDTLIRQVCMTIKARYTISRLILPDTDLRYVMARMNSALTIRRPPVDALIRECLFINIPTLMMFDSEPVVHTFVCHESEDVEQLLHQYISNMKIATALWPINRGSIVADALPRYIANKMYHIRPNAESHWL